MKSLRIVRALPLVPFAWLQACRCQKKTPEETWPVLSAWSLRVLGWMGYSCSFSSETDLSGVQGALFISNHQGTLDPALIAAFCPVPLRFVSKKSNEKLPLLGRWARAAGTLHFDRDSRKDNIAMLRQACRLLKSGKNVLIFPEGTRSRSAQCHPFQPGSLQPALLAKADIVPVVLQGSYALDVPSARIQHLHVHFLAPIPYEECRKHSQEELMALISTRIAEQAS